MNGRRALAGAIIFVALVLLIGRWSAALYTDYLWYASLDAGEVWRARAITTAVLTVGSFSIAFAFIFLNLFAVRHSVVSLVLPRRIANIEIGEEVPGRYLLAVVILMSVVAAGVLVFPADRWHEALLAHMGRAFGESDLYFSADLGFFVYWLPFEADVHFWAIIVLAATAVLVVMLYALTPSLRWERGTLYVSAYVRRHFTMLGGVVMLVLAWSYRLAMYHMLLAGSGAGGLFTSVDHRVLVPATLLLAIVTGCAAFVVMWAGWTGQMRIAFAAVSTVLLLSLVSRTVAPLMVRRSVDSSERRQQEMSYLGTRLSYTRVAYGVDHMRPELIGTGFATSADAATRLALWDGPTLARAAEHLRHVRVVSEQPGWEVNDGALVASLVTRNSDPSDTRDVWTVERFDPSAVDPKGQPVRTSSGSVDDLALSEPAVYDSAPGYSVMSDSARQLVGVEMVSTRSRLMHAWSLQNFRLLFGELPANRPVMVRRRDVRERVGTLAPFFVQGSEVVPLVADDSLYWVVELYAASSSYPLAQRITLLGAERSYFLHAATAIVHAASGRVHFLPAVAPDPIGGSWIKYFPDLFRTQGISRSVLNALPALTDGGRAQALAFAAAGFRGDSLEVRHFASPDGADSLAGRDAERAVIPAIPGVAAVWPLLDSTERVRGVVAAGGGANRVTAWIPIVGGSARWGTVLDRMRAADSVSSRDPSAVRASLRVAPVDGRALFVQPTFSLHAGGAPALLHVAALFGDSVRVATTLRAALGAMPLAAMDTNRHGDLRIRADSLYQAMRQALARGDWPAFGRAFDALGTALRSEPH